MCDSTPYIMVLRITERMEKNRELLHRDKYTALIHLHIYWSGSRLCVCERLGTANERKDGRRTYTGLLILSHSVKRVRRAICIVNLQAIFANDFATLFR